MKHFKDNHLGANVEKRSPSILHRNNWSTHEHLWKGSFQGEDIGTDVTVLFYVTDKLGEGPRWHVHQYDEIFIVRSGNALFTIGEKKIEAKAGNILLDPAEIPHKFHNIGPGSLETTDIHLSRRWIQTDLEDPELT